MRAKAGARAAAAAGGPRRFPRPGDRRAQRASLAPGTGSVCPALQQLQDDGLIQVESGEPGHRGYGLADSGREYVAAHELRAPWDVGAAGTGCASIEMRTMMGRLGMAAFQVASAGTDAQQAQAREVLAPAARRSTRFAAAEDQASAQRK